ncbi:rhomboid family intramembrane serine protease [Pelagibius marinus]|uniref:rhomboid family intramembrane serine protease n=1 Tax=Pelagibius marinus TaxID=2762760 RepID=UPI001872DDE4|nr:rhomboid family intramembrane serine protease [Pelagibius marinus]
MSVPPEHFHDPDQGPPPPRGREPVFNLPPGTLWLTLAMLACFALQNILEGPAWTWFMSALAFVSPVFWPPGSDLPSLLALPSLVTYAFLHADFMHLALNLGFFLAFGSFVERHLGLLPYLLLFALTAAAGALAEFWFRGAEPVALIGASGAVYGMTGAAMRFMFASGQPGQRRRALAFVGVFMGLNLVFGISGLGDFLAGAQIGWKAHAGGFIAGTALSFLLARRPPGLKRRA